MALEAELLKSEKKQLLCVMRKLPYRPGTEWASALDWLTPKNIPDQAKVTKRLIELESDGLVIRIGHRYIL